MFIATFSNISAISRRPVLVVEEAGVPETIRKLCKLIDKINKKISSPWKNQSHLC